jgi:hypothetical protein
MFILKSGNQIVNDSTIKLPRPRRRITTMETPPSPGYRPRRNSVSGAIGNDGVVGSSAMADLETSVAGWKV